MNSKSLAPLRVAQERYSGIRLAYSEAGSAALKRLGKISPPLQKSQGWATQNPSCGFKRWPPASPTLAKPARMGHPKASCAFKGRPPAEAKRGKRAMLEY